MFTRSASTKPAPTKAALSQNGLRQCLRVAGAGTLGFMISQLMGWNYGVFFTVFPMFLLGLVPVLNGSIIRQFLSNVSLNVLEVSLVIGLLKHMPVVMTLVVLGLFLMRFNLMAKGPLFLFGANGVLTLSILLHFASYPGVDLSDLLASNLMASLLAVFIAMLMHTLFPDVEPRQPPPRGTKPAAQIRHETLIGGMTATLSFVVFQVFDLRDSLSAQMATILILFTLGYFGAQISAAKRAVGTLLGCNLALVMQLGPLHPKPPLSTGDTALLVRADAVRPRACVGRGRLGHWFWRANHHGNSVWPIPRAAARSCL